MITLHMHPNQKESVKLEEKLQDLVISYKKVVHEDPHKGLPFVEEDGKRYRSEEEIKEWVSMLEKDLNWQRSISGDGCYIDPEDGKIC